MPQEHESEFRDESPDPEVIQPGDLGLTESFHVRGAGREEGFLARLVAIEGPQVGRSFLLNQQITTLGRSPENEIQVPSRSISRQHCRFIRTGTVGLDVEDLHSRNGVEVNGRPLESGERRQLAGGDLLGLSEITFLVRIDSGSTIVGDELQAISVDLKAVEREVDKLMDLHPEAARLRDSRKG